MAYVAGFEHDIFLSYSHVDNLRVASRRTGWIEAFHRDLEVRLAQRSGRIGDVTVWRDERRLKGNELFDVTIQEAIERSATFLAVTSHGYLASDYCRRELQAFHQKAAIDRHGLALGDKLRIFNVLLYDIPYERWPKECQNTTGIRFYSPTRASQHGKPNEPGKGEFDRRVYQLTEDIFSLLIEFAARVAKSAAPEVDNVLAEEHARKSEMATPESTPVGVPMPAESVQGPGDLRADPDATILLDFHTKDYDEAVGVDEFLRGRGFKTVTGPNADGPRRNIELFEERLKRCRAMVIPVHQVSDAWVRERVNAALQVIAMRDCPTRAILVHAIPPRRAPAPLGPQFGAVSVRWLDQSSADANRVDGLEQLLREIEVATT
jgi:hypothetical protein